MKTLLTSFKRWHEHLLPDASAFSIAVYQPKWLPRLPETSVFDIRGTGGRWTRPRDFLPEDHNPSLPSEDLINAYKDALYDLYAARAVPIERFMQSHEKDLALCCWCPYDKAAQRQLHDYGSFVCHSAVVELYLVNHGYEVTRDVDRDRMVRFT